MLFASKNTKTPIKSAEIATRCKRHRTHGMDGDWDASSPSTRLLTAPGVLNTSPVRTKRKRDEPSDDEDAEAYAPKYSPFPKTPGFFKYSPPVTSPSYTPEGSPVRESLPTLQTKHGNIVSLSFIPELGLAELHTAFFAVAQASSEKPLWNFLYPLDK